jgi:hypothetical protein
MDLDKTITDRVEEKQLVWYGMVTYKGCQKRGGQRRFGNGPHMEEGEEDDHEGPGLIISRRPWQAGTLMNKISRTVRGGEEVARNVRKGCRTLDDDDNS